MSETERAWAAGFFDGEGSATANHSRAATFTLSVSQKDRRPLDRFVAAVGSTRVYEHRLFSVVYSGRKGIEAARSLWPFLSEPKREQIRRVMEDAMARRSRRYPLVDAAYDDFWEEIKP